MMYIFFPLAHLYLFTSIECTVNQYRTVEHIHLFGFRIMNFDKLILLVLHLG